MSISARDEQNQPVDTWFAYKVPKLIGGQTSAGATGYEYAYYDRKVGAFAKSPSLMNDKQGALFYTLDAVFGNPAGTYGWVLYNDEMPADAGVLRPAFP